MQQRHSETSGGAAAVAPSEPAGRAALAIGLVLAVMLAFAIMDGLTKMLSQKLPIPQIIWVRNIAFTVLALSLLRAQYPGRSLLSLARSGRPALQFGRALLLVLECGVFMVAFRMMPLADVHAVAAASPLLVVALSVVMLGERVGPRRWIAVLVGFAGVLLIVRPGFDRIEPAVLIVLLGTAMWALYQILVRICARVDRSETTSLWTAVVGLGAASLVGPAVWVWPDAEDWLLLCTIAVLGGIAHIGFIKALSLTQPSLLQPYSYTLFVWAVAVGYVLFGHVPDAWTLCGAGVIIASGIYVWYRERVRAMGA